MNVLVTGSDGYIGSLLAPFLVEQGYEVVGLDACLYRDGWLYDSGVKPLTSARKDIRRIEEDDLKGIDAVVHLAELSNDPLGQFRPEVTHDINYLGSLRVARTCHRAGVTRFVYSSSCSVYGIGSDDVKTEESCPNPQTAYARCKVLVERELDQMANDEFSPTVLRNATAYGPSPRMRFDIVLNNLAGLAWTTGKIRMTSDGTPWRPLIHVLDICQAISCTLAAPREIVHNQVFNVGDDQANYQIRQLAEIVSDTFPGCEVSLGEGDRDKRSYRVSFEKINNKLPGFRCQRDARLGAHELREVFERIDMSRETFEFRAYTRLRQLEHLLRTRQIDDDFFWTELSRSSMTAGDAS